MLEYTARLACGGVDRVNCVGCCPVELLLLLRDELLALLCAVQRRDPRSFFIYRLRRLKQDSDCTRTRRNPQCRPRRNTVALACVAVVPRFGCTSYVTIRQVSFMRHLKKICGPHKHRICGGNMVQNWFNQLLQLVPEGPGDMDGAILLATRWSR